MANKPNKDVSAQIQGARGGKKGGPARAAKLTPTQRTEIAKKGAEAKNAKYGKTKK